MHVLRADLDVLCFSQGLDHFRDGSERRHDHHFHRRHVADLQQQIFDELGRLGLQHVHLPVGGDVFLSHTKTRSPRAKRGKNPSPARTEGSRRESLKVTQRDPPAPPGMTQFYFSLSPPPPGSSSPSNSSRPAPPPVE